MNSDNKTPGLYGHTKNKLILEANPNTGTPAISNAIPNTGIFLFNPLIFPPTMVSIGYPTLRSIHIRGTIKFTPSSITPKTTQICLFLILDTVHYNVEPPTDPLITDIFNSTDLTTAETNPFTEDRFKIIKKWTLNLTSNAGTNAAPAADIEPFEYFTLCNIPLIAASQVQSNSKRIFFIAGCDTNTTNTSTFKGFMRIRYEPY